MAGLMRAGSRSGPAPKSGFQAVIGDTLHRSPGQQETELATMCMAIGMALHMALGEMFVAARSRS